MARYFTQYWTQETCTQDARYAGHLLEYTAGNQFRDRSVAEGDVVYAVTVRHGRLFVIGRLTVDEVVGPLEASRVLGEDSLIEGADEYVIAASATPMHFHIEVPVEVTEKLLFIASPHSKRLHFVEPGVLDKQTLRGIRELEPASAKALDEFLSEEKPIENGTNVV
jgi:hypothetical protein